MYLTPKYEVNKLKKNSNFIFRGGLKFYGRLVRKLINKNNGLR